MTQARRRVAAVVVTAVSLGLPIQVPSADAASPPPASSTPTFSPGAAPANPTFTAGSITIVEHATEKDAHDFGFTGCRVGFGCSSFSLDDDSDATLPNTVNASSLPAGTYTVTQAAPSQNWTLTGITCSAGGTVDVDARQATIALDGNEAVTCTFANTAPSLTVVHSAAPELGDDFSFTGCQDAGPAAAPSAPSWSATPPATVP